MAIPPPPPFALFGPPYRRLEPLDPQPEASCFGWEGGPGQGRALVWCLSGRPTGQDFELVRGRTPGLALLAVLPPARVVSKHPDLLRIVGLCRPHGLLPHHAPLALRDLRQLLRQPPVDLAADLVEYLEWRGLSLQQETRELVRKIVDRSVETRTVAGLARGLYRSRRALGRHFTTRGLPVPSHWLHFSRVLRAGIQLQNQDQSLFTIATRLGYPDGFALSNQMKRLTGVRPSRVRDRLGWEWFVEAWISTEVENDGFSAERRRELVGLADSGVESQETGPPPSMSRPGSRVATERANESTGPVDPESGAGGAE